MSIRSDAFVRALLRDVRVRQGLRATFKRPDAHGPELSLGYIDALVKWIADARAEARHAALKHLNPALRLSLMGMMTVGMFALAFDDKTTRLLPDDWAGDKRRPDADDVLGLLLTQTTNHALAIMYLVESGMENSARILVRALHEVCWLTLTVAADREKMRAYVAGRDLPAASAIWRTHFTKRALNESVSTIERRLKLHRTTKRGERDRDEAYRFFSASVHHAYLVSVTLSHSWEFGRRDRNKKALFGRASQASFATLRALNEVLAHSVGLLTPIITKLHRRTIPERLDGTWGPACALRESYLALVLKGRRVRTLRPRPRRAR